MSYDLVKRASFALSDMQGRIDATKLQVFQNCIDRIEELEAKALANKIAIMRLEAERNKFQLYLQRTHADLELEIAAVDGLNAKLSEAMEGLKHYACDCGEMCEQLKGSCGSYASTTLAKIKGEQL